MKKLIKPMAEDNQSNLFLQLTERWQDGQYAQVADYIRHDVTFSNRANLIDFCVYLSNYLGMRELRVLQKLI
mgnify:CR=1 FL=1|tara:strand:- start:4201 stop:4416 length:216 start_codon:yes stop_codon:yes gene_type:complete